MASAQDAAVRPAHVPAPVATPDAVLRAIYGERGAAEKKAEFEASLRRHARVAVPSWRACAD